MSVNFSNSVRQYVEKNQIKISLPFVIYFLKVNNSNNNIKQRSLAENIYWYRKLYDNSIK